jgi:response regulator RpfG family c-di-GMP phosphodiesterase
VRIFLYNRICSYREKHSGDLGDKYPSKNRVKTPYRYALVVDDCLDIAKLVKTALELDGSNVYEFNDPFLALDYFRVNYENISLVIADVRMPGMSRI